MNKLFQERGYVEVKELLDISTVRVISKYLENKIKRGEWEECFNPKEVGDSRYGYYSDPLIEVLLEQSLQSLEEITDLKLEPAYSYARVYQQGEQLHAHTDRPACEITASINIAVVGDVWPIWVQYEDMDPVKILLNPGDALIYKGCDTTHWRNKLEEKQINVQIMLHYVEKNGNHNKYKFDEREGLGYDKNQGIARN